MEATPYGLFAQNVGGAGFTSGPKAPLFKSNHSWIE